MHAFHLPSIHTKYATSHPPLPSLLIEKPPSPHPHPHTPPTSPPHPKPSTQP
ncbi:predicted protein [Plenodomus lingam JN3]|uniref:Predicted protein n=1 Tax=Leptosphaeria maculans (strain JN3 / isolate v23.1.3 / race Av1-4-5-6-7-8) TaxID=985895 RepID=E5A0A0_LEPMJ|nr:predicted protein [Plenodomus lingam JN3]CBX96960.1 predicted protein [Plenodomus lingam JN3]